jgi:hypothetical protein
LSWNPNKNRAKEKHKKKIRAHCGIGVGPDIMMVKTVEYYGVELGKDILGMRV